MAIDLTKEKNNEFTPQDRYDIINAAIEDSYDDGFMNIFVFERALYCYAYAALLETDELNRKELFIGIHANPLKFWTNNLDEMEKMFQEHRDSLNNIAEDAATWFVEYTEYAYSTRGMLDNLGDIMRGVTQRAEDELTAMQENGELQSVINIAEDWGINRALPVEHGDTGASTKEEAEARIINGDSLFV